MAKQKKNELLELARTSRGLAREQVIAEGGLPAWRGRPVRFADQKKVANASVTRSGKASRRMYGSEV